VLQSLWSPKPHIYSVDRFEVPDKKSAVSELKPGMAGRYIRVVYEEDRAFLAADVGLLPLDFVFAARLAVLTDDHELGAVFGALTGAELEARASRIPGRRGPGRRRPHGRNSLV